MDIVSETDAEGECVRLPLPEGERDALMDSVCVSMADSAGLGLGEPDRLGEPLGLLLAE